MSAKSQKYKKAFQREKQRADSVQKKLEQGLFELLCGRRAAEVTVSFPDGAEVVVSQALIEVILGDRPRVSIKPISPSLLRAS